MQLLERLLGWIHRKTRNGVTDTYVYYSPGGAQSLGLGLQPDGSLRIVLSAYAGQYVPGGNVVPLRKGTTGMVTTVAVLVPPKQLEQLREFMVGIDGHVAYVNKPTIGV